VNAFHHGLGKNKDDYQQHDLPKQSPIHHLSPPKKNYFFFFLAFFFL
jgi:hypothetical protein